MTNAQTKFIVWDWNGTLLNDTDAMLGAVNVVLSRIGQPALSMEKFRETQVRPIETFYRTVGVPEEQISDVLKIERDIFHDHYEPMADHAPLHQGASNLLHQLKKNGVHNVILSNHITNQIIRLLKFHNIHQYFEEVLAYSDRKTQFQDMTKGQKLHRYLDVQHLKTSNGIIVGDTIEEVEIARELGLCSIAVTEGTLAEHHLRAAKPDYIAHSFDELTPILQQRGFAA